ncbi:MAG: hypothetical protein GY759_06205 [Chloroflexi bacterium]|nr:hypothetical protein [Chloroflexota bacterium]
MIDHLKKRQLIIEQHRSSLLRTALAYGLGIVLGPTVSGMSSDDPQVTSQPPGTITAKQV